VEEDSAGRAAWPDFRHKGRHGEAVDGDSGKDDVEAFKSSVI
jgi:hypothetical protein